MKNLSFSITFLLLIQLCAAQTVKNSLFTQHLKGKVKKIESSTYNGNPKDGSIDTLAPHNKSVYLFDENGNETEDTYFDKDGMQLSKFVRKYDTGNKNIGEDYFSKAGVLESNTVLKYNERGNVVEADYEFIADKTSSDKTLYKYDDKDNVAEDDVYKADGSLRYKDIYKYDSKGNKIEMDYFHASEDTMRVKWTFSYNDAGLKVREARYTPNSQLQIENMFTYEKFDKLANWLQETRTSKGVSKQFANHATYAVTIRKIYYY